MKYLVIVAIYLSSLGTAYAGTGVTKWSYVYETTDNVKMTQSQIDNLTFNLWYKGKKLKKTFTTEQRAHPWFIYGDNYDCQDVEISATVPIYQSSTKTYLPVESKRVKAVCPPNPPVLCK